MRAAGLRRRAPEMIGAASRVAVCIGRWKAITSAASKTLGSSFSLAVSTHTTSDPCAPSHAAADATPKGWRPISYVLTRTLRMPRQSLYSSGDDDDDDRSRSEFLRPSARAVDALLHRDVGALQLLRHARAAHP